MFASGVGVGAGSGLTRRRVKRKALQLGAAGCGMSQSSHVPGPGRASRFRPQSAWDGRARCEPGVLWSGAAGGGLFWRTLKTFGHPAPSYTALAGPSQPSRKDTFIHSRCLLAPPSCQALVLARGVLGRPG